MLIVLRGGLPSRKENVVSISWDFRLSTTDQCHIKPLINQEDLFSHSECSCLDHQTQEGDYAQNSR